MTENIIKKIVRSAVKKGSFRLDVCKPKINYKSHDGCFVKVKYSCRHELHIDITQLIVLGQIKSKNEGDIFPYIKESINGIRKRIEFIIYHELAHIYQFENKNKWFNNNKYTLNNTISASEYRNLKMENNADKIALCLLKKGGVK